MNFSTYRSRYDLNKFVGFFGQATLANAAVESALDIVVRRLKAYGLILLLIVWCSLFHDDHLGWALSLEDLREGAQWIPMRLIAIDLAESLVRVLALASEVPNVGNEPIG